MSRTRRTIRIIGPWRAGVSVAFGILLTVTIACWIELQPDALPAFPFHRSVPFASHPSGAMPEPVLKWWRDDAGDEREVVAWWDTGQNRLAVTFPDAYWPGVIWSRWIHEGEPEPEPARPDWAMEWGDVGRLASETGERAESVRRLMVYRSGWPFVALEKRVMVMPREFVPVIGRGNLPLVLRKSLGIGERAIAPTRIVFPGFVLNVLVYGLPLYGVLSIPACVRASRKGRDEVVSENTGG